MVKIQSKTIRKKYKPTAPPYTYTQHLMLFPLEQNDELTPFLKQELEFTMTVNEDILHITLKKRKHR
ncbi:MAG: hypothetical protein GX799_03460 [Crenarchaeota archaeon]|nr:hypothetical protein [Thermoproteota archaeon]